MGASPEDPLSEQILYCIVPCPMGIRDRDFLQRSWQLRPPGGSWVMLFQSFKDEALRPERHDLVRAWTMCSGYIVRPCPRGTEGQLQFVSVTHMDFGTALPAWIQSVLRRAMKGR